MAKDFAELNRLDHEAGIQAPEAGRKQDLVNKFVKAWENETARRAVKGGTGLSMALTLAACGGSSGGGFAFAPSTQGDAAPTTPIQNLIALVDGGITAISGADPIVEVASPTPGADALSTTIGAGGTGTLTLQFADAEDVVTLDAASDLSGYDTLAISAGTVDVTAVDLTGITSITVSSGVTLTAAQFLGLSGGVTGGSADSSVTIVISTAAEAADIIAAVASFGGTLDAAAVSFELTADSLLTDADLVNQNAALDAAIIEAGVPSALPIALDALDAANAAVAAKQAEIGDYLEAAFTNEFVADATTDQGVDGVDAADVIADDLDQANDAAAVALLEAAEAGDQGVQLAAGTAFNADTDAAQAAQINAARISLQAEIDIAAGNPALDLAGTTTALIDAAISAAGAVEGAIDALGAASDAETVAVAGFVGGNGLTEVTTAAADVDAADEVFFADTGVITVAVENGANFVGVEITEVVDGVAVLKSAGDLAADNAAIADAAAGQALLDDIAAAPGFNAVLPAINARLSAQEDLTTSQDALADAVNAVYNDFDPDGYDADDVANTGNVQYDFTYAELSAGAGNVIVVNQDGTVTVNLDGTIDAPNVANAADFAPLAGYAGAVQTLADAEQQLADFNAAVADWQAANALVDGYDALVAELGTLNDEVTAARAEIENGPNDDPAGLDVAIVEAIINAVTFGGADTPEVHIFNSENGDLTVTAFAADGSDRFYTGGEGEYTFVELGDQAITDVVGSSSAFEIFAEQDGNNVNLYVEGVASAGNGTTPAANNADITTVTLVNVDLADLSFDAATDILTAEAAAV